MSDAPPDPGGTDADSADPAPEPPPPPRRGFLRRHWGKITLAVVILVPLAVFAVWSAIAMSYSYSSGERVGYVQKLSRKGWLCKTWEGELQMSNIPGSAPLLFQFTVRSDSLAQVIESIAGRAVALRYEQHVGLPTTCFGETEYFITGVREVRRP